MTANDPEEVKLVTLARGARSRVAAAQGAAVRDETGRTYSTANVSLPSLSLSAAELAVAMAAASGSRGLEAVVISTDSASLTDGDRAVISDFAGTGVPVVLVDTKGTEVARLTS
jgi:cytidine deaminase